MKKRIISLLLACSMAVTALAGCGGSSDGGAATDSAADSTEAAADAGDASSDTTSGNAPSGATAAALPDWSVYDNLITEIRTTSDTAARVGLMHQAEDMLFDTGCIIPLYYYVNQYMVKPEVKGLVYVPTGMHYFQYGTKDSGDTTFNACLASEPDYLDPQLNSSVDGGILAVNSFEGLATMGPDGVFTGGQAESWTNEVQADGSEVWTFTMRDGLKWSNGDELTAKDFEWSWNRAVADETAADYAYLYDVIKRDDSGKLMAYASEDGKTFTVTLAAPCAYFIDLVAFPALFPVHQASVEAGNPDGSVPGGWALEAGDTYVCNGAWVLSAWEHDTSMTYVKNPNYRDAANVTFETCNYMLTGDDTIAFQAYETGDLDFSLRVPTAEVQGLKSRLNQDYFEAPYLGTYYCAFNITTGLYDKLGLTDYDAQVKFRNAISLLIDRDYIVTEIGQAGQVPANTFIPDGCNDGNGGIFRVDGGSYSYPVETGYFPLSDYDANVATALSYLEEIGFKIDNGMVSSETPISFDYLVNESTGNIAIAEAIQSDLKSVGIDMTITTEEWNVFLEDRKNGNYDFAREGWIMDYNDPVNMLELWTTDSGNNDCQFGRY